MGLSNKLIDQRKVLFSLLILRILDVTTTYIALRKGAYETNPYTRFIYDIIGVNNILYTLPLQIFIVVICIYMIYQSLSHVDFKSDNTELYYYIWNFIIIILLVINIIIPINNILVIGDII